MANATVRGGRWVRSATGATRPSIQRALVADNYATQLVVGDFLTRVATGYVQRAVGSEGTQTDILGLLVNVVQRWDSNVGAIVPSNYVPANTRWGTGGTVYESRTIVEYIPAVGNIFELDCDTAEGTSFDTQTEMDALLGENADLVVESVTGRFPVHVLDISGHNTTNTLQMRIVGFPEYSVAGGGAQDFSTTLRLKAHVICNRPQDPSANTTGI